MAEADIIKALIEHLKADEAVATIVGERVFGGELPDDETGHMPRAGVVIRPSGGGSLVSGSFAQHDTQRVDILAYGATPLQANALSRLCRTALSDIRRAVIAHCLVHWVEPAGGFSAGRDRDAAWPVAFQSFQAFYALQEV